jgi:Fe-S cluster assembly protein SufD
VLINGVLDEQLSDFNEINSVTITTLRKALENKDKTALKYFNNIATNKTVFDFLNMANVSEGLFISVDKNIQLKKPLHIINLSVSENAHVLIPTRNLIVIGKNSEASIIQSYLGKGDTGYFHTINSEIFIDANAKLNLYKIELENNFANHINKTDVIQKVDSVFRHFNFSFNGKLIRNDINVELEGENIETILNGLYLGNDEQHIDNNTFINHLKPHSTSNELYKGILNDKSHAVFSGKILVEKNAQLTNAYQNNNTILLSDNATVDTKPQLEIYADDVKCTHGATVGQLDESALFYILSRGIPKDKARTMLINAFAESIVSEIPIKELQNEITDLIYNNLHREL